MNIALLQEQILQKLPRDGYKPYKDVIQENWKDATPDEVHKAILDLSRTDMIRIVQVLCVYRGPGPTIEPENTQPV